MTSGPYLDFSAPPDPAKVLHPAPFTPSVLKVISHHPLLPSRGLIVDPFAGIGRVHSLATPLPDLRLTLGIEIEPLWAATHPDTVVGDSTALSTLLAPFLEALAFSDYSRACRGVDWSTVAAIVTSPTYGNRMADHHYASDPSTRRSYTHDLRRSLNSTSASLDPNNTGRYYAWSDTYWDLHRQVWAECFAVLAPGAPAFVNVSDCIRKGQVVEVTAGHRALLASTGFDLLETIPVPTPRMGFGANRSARVEAESIIVCRKPPTPAPAP